MAALTVKFPPGSIYYNLIDPSIKYLLINKRKGRRQDIQDTIISLISPDDANANANANSFSRKRKNSETLQNPNNKSRLIEHFTSNKFITESDLDFNLNNDIDIYDDIVRKILIEERDIPGETQIKPLLDFEIEVMKNSNNMEIEFIPDSMNSKFCIKPTKKLGSYPVKVVFQLRNHFANYRSFNQYIEAKSKQLPIEIDFFDEKDQQEFIQLSKFPVILSSNFFEKGLTVDTSYLHEYNREEFYLITCNQIEKMKKIKQVGLHKEEYVINFRRDLHTKLQIKLIKCSKHIDVLHNLSLYDPKFLNNWTKDYLGLISN